MKRGSLILSIAFALISADVIRADTTWVSGTITNQIWTSEGSPYCLANNVHVATLTIQPGVRVVAMGDYVFEVAGILTAVGTETDSILFTRSIDALGWQGIVLNRVAPGTYMAYCCVELATNHGLTIDHSPYATIQNCLFRWNSHHGGVDGFGGGVYVTGNATLANCRISENATSSTANEYTACYSRGGGICADSLTLIGCTVESNTAYTHPTWGWGHAHGGGIYAQYQLTLRRSMVGYNVANAVEGGGPSHHGESRGGGVASHGMLMVTNSVIFHNSSIGLDEHHGGGACILSGTGLFVNSSVAHNNYASGIACDGDSVVLRNSICYSNDGAMLTGNAVVNYCDIEGGWPFGIGNIDFNPVFASDSNLIIQPGSRCIDAGDPDTEYSDLCFPPSLGTSRNDIGAHGGPGACEWSTAAEFPSGELPSRFALLQNYPNPFNPRTTLRFEVPQAGRVSLRVVDLLGREVAVLFEGVAQAGVHETTFDGSQLASGLYFARFESGSFAQARKLVLLK